MINFIWNTWTINEPVYKMVFKNIRKLLRKICIRVIDAMWLTFAFPFISSWIIWRFWSITAKDNGVSSQESIILGSAPLINMNFTSSVLLSFTATQIGCIPHDSFRLADTFSKAMRRPIALQHSSIASAMCGYTEPEIKNLWYQNFDWSTSKQFLFQGSYLLFLREFVFLWFGVP